jgi:hypothetical protein
VLSADFGDGKQDIAIAGAKRRCAIIKLIQALMQLLSVPRKRLGEP